MQLHEALLSSGANNGRDDDGFDLHGLVLALKVNLRQYK